jgi:hypothetical protein
MIEKALGGRAIGKQMLARLTARRWEECVGPQLVERSIPEKFDDGTLWVAVSGASWATELRMRKDEILERLNQLAGQNLFSDIRFGVRKVERTADSNSEEAPVIPEPVDVVVSVPELAEPAAKALGKLKAIARRARRD